MTNLSNYYSLGFDWSKMSSREKKGSDSNRTSIHYIGIWSFLETRAYLPRILAEGWKGQNDVSEKKKKSQGKMLYIHVSIEGHTQVGGRK